MKTVNVFALTLLLTTAHGKARAPQKIAILGGGASSCTTALALTAQPGWKERYNITIYQLGWRLGGKAASGRNKNYGQRVEEVTGHMFAGVYHNSKRLLRSVYEKLNRPEGAPMRTFEEAFKLLSHTSFKELNSSLDGEEQCFSLKYLFQRMVKSTFWMIESMTEKFINISPIQMNNVNLKNLTDDPKLLRCHINSIQDWVFKMSTMAEEKTEQTEFLSVLDVAVTIIKGILGDNILENGFDIINHLDLRKWLAKHGANPTTLNSTFVKFHYDLMIAYKNGDIDQPSLEAGASLKIYLNLYFCFDDAPYYDQQGGLGDIIFAPMYELLRKKGVHFKFFHKVEELNLNIEDSRLIETIKLTKQVDLVHEEYDPLVNIKGLPSWPNEPKYEEIDQELAKLLQKYDIDLESFWTRWPSIYEEHFKQPLPEVILKRGKDFDIIVFGIPVGSLPYLCSELLEVSSSLRDASKHMGKIPSFQLQLTVDETRDKLESKLYRDIVDPKRENAVYMVADNDPHLKLESWQSIKMSPKSIAYITTMKSAKEIPPGGCSSSPYVKKMNKNFVASITQSLLKNNWPNAYKDGEFKWNILTDPKNRTGVERLDAQFWRTNINPSDLYTPILTNTSQYRIKTDGAGFNNIYFTGDWIENGFNCCIEAAVTAGLLTSKAISGYPKEIFWEQYVKSKN